MFLKTFSTEERPPAENPITTTPQGEAADLHFEASDSGLEPGGFEIV